VPKSAGDADLQRHGRVRPRARTASGELFKTAMVADRFCESRGFCLLIALATSIAAHADSPAQPIPADGKCAVQVDPNWTKQEKFVWLKVCIGEAANFNIEYGDYLDPRRPKGLPDNRILSSSFLETILLKDKYRSALTRLGVRIIGARFTETVDLQNAELRHDLFLDGSFLENGANLQRIETSHRISFDGSKILGTLDMNGIRVDEDLFMRKSAQFNEIVLRAAHIGGNLSLSGCTVTGVLNMNGIRVDQNLFMRDNAQFNKIDLTAAHIGGELELSGSTVTGKLDMNTIDVHEHLVMRDNAQFKDIDLLAAHIGGLLDLSGSTVTGMLDMYGIRVDQNLLMHDRPQFKGQFTEIDLTGAHIGGKLEPRGSTVTGTLNMSGIRVDENLLMQDKAQFNKIDLTAAHIGGQLDLRSSTVAGKLEGEYIDVEQTMYLGDGATFIDAIDLTSAKLGQDVHLSGGTFKSYVDLTGAQIGGVLSLKSTRWPGSDYINRTGAANLNLTGAAVGGIDLSHDWPDKIYLNGLTYRNLSNLAGNFSRAQAETWFGKQAYAPQPYEQLASVLQSNGWIEDATAIRYAGKEQERKAAWGLYWERLLDWERLLSWARLFLINYSVGFGYHLEFAFYWAAVFVLLGWAVLYAAGQRTKHGITLGLAYSFDMLLPLVQLRKKHYDIDLDPWPQRYFFVHKIIGVILASFIVAGITGLTK
jgi:hypothetical protein